MYPLRLAWIGWLLASGIAGVAQGACPDPAREWIGVEFEPAQPSRAENAGPVQLELRIVEHLRAEFAQQSIDVCIGSGKVGSRAALATLRIERAQADVASVRAWVNDAVTDKEVSRRLSLAGLPGDAHALAIAAGASELLRASWSELRLRSAASERGTAPAVVEGVVGSYEQAAAASGAVSLGTGFEVFTGGAKQGGLDAELSYGLSRFWNVAARIGGRSAVRAKGIDGEIGASGWIFGVATSFTIAHPIDALRLSLVLRTDAMRVNFSGYARQGAAAYSQSGTTCWAALGMGAEWRLSRRLLLDGGFLAGLVLAPVVATDNGRRVLEFSEEVVEAHAGLKIPF